MVVIHDSKEEVVSRAYTPFLTVFPFSCSSRVVERAKHLQCVREESALSEGPPSRLPLLCFVSSSVESLSPGRLARRPD